MRTLTFAAVLAATALSAVPALAQNAASPFTGVRAEGTLGWERLGAPNGHDDDVQYGFGVGYDAAVGQKLIVGLEGEIADSGAKRCGTFATTTDRLCTSTGRDLYIGARAGVPLTPSLLLYGKAGYTNGRFRTSYDDGLGTLTTDSRDRSGYRLGVGAEYAVTPHSFVKTEYRYSNYSGNIDKHQMVVGAGFRF